MRSLEHHGALVGSSGSPWRSVGVPVGSLGGSWGVPRRPWGSLTGPCEGLVDPGGYLGGFLGLPWGHWELAGRVLGGHHGCI